MARGAAFQHQHFEGGGEAAGFALPIVQDGGRADDQRGLAAPLAGPQPGQPDQRLQRFSQAHVVGQNSAQLVPAQMAQEIEARPLVGSQVRPGCLPGSGVGGMPRKFRQALAQRPAPAACRQIACSPASSRCAACSRPSRCGTGDQSVHAQVGHRFVGRLHRGGVQFQPAGVGQFDKAPGGRLQALQVGGRELESLRLPFRGNGKPVNAAAFDDQARAQGTRAKEQAVKGGVAQVFGLGGAIRPGGGQLGQEISFASPHPQPRFGREPVQPAQPLDGLLQPGVVQDCAACRTVRAAARRSPIRGRSNATALPSPRCAPAAAGARRSSANSKVKRGCALVHHAQLLPIRVVGGLGLAQLGQQAGGSIC